MTTEDYKKILTLFHIGSFPLNAKEAGDFVYLNNKIVEEVKQIETQKEETESE